MMDGSWLPDGTRLCESLVAGLSDADTAGPTLLPGWSRGHIVTHLARNADALVNLLDWARTGDETPMYANATRRDADIEAGAGRPRPALVSDLLAADARLAAAADALTAPQWAARVRTAQGRDVPASVVTWLRVRELWIHAVDLRVGTTFADLPPALVDALLDDVVAGLTARPGAPALRLSASDRQRSWSVGDDSDPVAVAAPACDLLAWLTGRGAISGAPRPPRWL